MQYSGIVARALLPVLEPLQSSIPTMRSRVVPSAFSGSDSNLRSVPLPTDWSWPSLGVYLQALHAEILVNQLPTFWQLAPYVFYAARGVQVPLITLDVQNYQLDKAALLYAGATTILAEAHEAESIVAHVRKENVAPPASMVLLHAADAADFGTPASLGNTAIAIAHEVHLLPGLPLLVQCEHTCTQGKAVFHFSDHVAWDGNTDSPAVSIKLPTFVIEKLPLPFSLREVGTCACGKTLVERSVRQTQ